MFCCLRHVAGATTTWPNSNVAYLSQNMSFFLASFFAIHICMQGIGFNKEPSKKAQFNMIARPVKSLVHFMALKMVQKCGPSLL